MKTFYEKFRDKIDHSDNSVVLFEGEYKEIQLEAFKAGMDKAAQIAAARNYFGNNSPLLGNAIKDICVFNDGLTQIP